MLTRKRIRGVLQIAISVALLSIILRQVKWGEVRAALQSIELSWLALAWGMFVLGVVVRAARWQTLLVALGVQRPLSELSTWYFVGSFFNVVLPTGFGGDAVRVAELAQDTQRLDLAVNSVVVDRYLGLMVLLAMGLISGMLIPGVAPAAVAWVTAALFMAGLMAAVALAMPWWADLAARPGLLGRVVSLLKIPTLAAAVRPYDRRTLARALAISLVLTSCRLAGTSPSRPGHRGTDHLFLRIRALDRSGASLAGLWRPWRTRDDLCRFVCFGGRTSGASGSVVAGRLCDHSRDRVARRPDLSLRGDSAAPRAKGAADRPEAPVIHR